MKTVGRILIILIAFAIVMGTTYAAVNAGTSSSSSTNGPVLERGSEGLPRSASERPELRGEGMAGVGLFGLIKNMGIVALIVALITVPKSLLRRKAIPVPINRT